jgi:hypothetical protein
MTAFFPATPLKMGSLLILALLAVISFLAIRIIFPDSHGNRDQFHDMPAAEQCLNKFGVHTTMSEPKNQKIHLICVNLDTGDVYDVIYKVRNVVEGVTTMKATEKLVNDVKIPITSIEQFIEYRIAEGKIIIATTDFAPFELVVQQK